MGFYDPRKAYIDESCGFLLSLQLSQMGERERERESEREKETLSIYYLVLDKGKGFRASRTFPILRSFYASRPLGQTPVP